MSYKTNIHFNRIIANDIDASYVELAPFSGQQSFYHKASALLTPFYNALFSYNTPILFYRDGQLIRLNDGYTIELDRGWRGKEYKEVKVSRTTMNHITAFCGINRKEYLALPYDPDKVQECMEYINADLKRLGVKL